MKAKDLLIAGALLCASASRITAQTTASISGMVRDQNGLSVKDVSVEAFGQKTSEKRKLTANADGSFSLAQLPPDVYQVSATCPTCSDDAKVVEVGAGQSRSVELSLNTNSASTEIAVDEHAATLDASSPKMGMNVSATEIGALPVNGRTFAPLALAAPFVANSASATFQDLRYAGQSSEQNRYLLDGIDTSSVISEAPGYLPVDGYNFRLRTSLDTVEEFRVDSVGYSAEDGGTTGAQIKLVSKSGSDQWHGAAFEYLRNDHLEARNFFDGAKPGKLRMNQFGASAGGDFIKDKLFVFGSVEELKQRTASNVLELVPSLGARERAVSAIAPVLLAIPAGSATSDPDIAVAARQSVSSQDESNQGIRLDYLATATSRFALRYSRSAARLNSPDVSTTDRNINAASKPDQTVLSWSDQINPTLINQFAVGLNRSPVSVSALSAAAPVSSRFFDGATASPGDLMLFSDGLYGQAQSYGGRSYNLNDSLTIMHGAHTLEAGAEFRAVRVPFSSVGGVVYSVRNLDSLLANEDLDVTYFPDLPKRMGEEQQYAGYLQDQWRVSPQIQAVFGLRYDYFGAMSEQHDEALLFNPVTAHSTAAKGGFYSASKTGFEPRAGITWSPKRMSGNTVLRAGAGIYNGTTAVLDAMTPIVNSAPSLFVRGADFPFTPGSARAKGGSLVERALDLSSFGKPQRNYAFTASVQQALPWKLGAQVGYAGILSRHLTQQTFGNLSRGVDPATGAVIPAHAGYAEASVLTNGGNSSYNALQLGMNRHLTSDLTLTASYNLSHSIGDAQGSGETMAPQNPLCLVCEMSDNSFDVRQSFSANAVYGLPFGKGHQMFTTGVSSALLSGWTVAGDWNSRTGLPVNVLANRSDEIYFSPSAAKYYSPSSNLPADSYAVINAPLGLESVRAFRPDVVNGVTPYLKNRHGLTWLNPAAFASPLAGSFGNLGRNALRGPGFAQLDLQLSRHFKVTEHAGLEAKVEAFNLFNHTNFSNPNPLLPDSTIDVQPGTAYNRDLAAGFGSLTSTVGRTIGLGTARQLQMSMRLDF